jgi:hypothetical protein
MWEVGRMSKKMETAVLGALILSIAANALLLWGYLHEREQSAAYEYSIVEGIDFQLKRVIHFLGRPVQGAVPVRKGYTPAVEAAFTAASLMSSLFGYEEPDLEQWTCTFRSRVEAVESIEEASQLRDEVHELLDYLYGYTGADAEILEKEGKGFPKAKRLFIIRMKRYLEQKPWVRSGS